MNKFNKKYLILPIVLVTGIIGTSVMTTGTNIATQSVYRDRNELKDQTLYIVEKIETQSSLRETSSKVIHLGFVPAKFVQALSQQSLSMAIR